MVVKYVIVVYVIKCLIKLNDDIKEYEKEEIDVLLWLKNNVIMIRVDKYENKKNIFWRKD